MTIQNQDQEATQENLVRFSCPVHGELVETFPTAEVFCGCGRRATIDAT